MHPKSATFKSRHRSSRGNSTLYEPLATWDLLNNLAFRGEKNVTPTPYGSPRTLSANFRENSAIFTKNCIFLLPEKCCKPSLVTHFHTERSFSAVGNWGSESIQFERAPRDRTLGRRQITRNMQFSKFKMRAT